jgi:hypothetical protein
MWWLTRVVLPDVWFAISDVINTDMRPLCPTCKQRLCAINCLRKGKYYYAKECGSCIRKKKKLPQQKPKWEIDGYKKKNVCDRCGFRARYSAQLVVYHVDGNCNNSAHKNLKTICQNCVVEVSKSDLPWKKGDLQADI